MALPLLGLPVAAPQQALDDVRRPLGCARARAAAGPIFDAQIPAGFHSRNVLPLLAKDGGKAYPLEPCMVHHLPWKDYRDDTAPQGKRLVSETFTLDPPRASELRDL